MPRPITEADSGLKVLVEHGSKDVVDFLAVHGRGAHPDETWWELRKEGLDKKDPQSYVNWLNDRTMLPKVAPNARIMRYGYESAWFGEERTNTSPRIISPKLLLQLSLERKDFPQRPLIILAHSFGGLVALQTLLDAYEDKQKWPDIYESTVGLVFFGTPFRGTHELAQDTLLELAEKAMGQGQVLSKALRVSEKGDESLVGMVDRYMNISSKSERPKVACFIEQRPTNVAVVIDKEQSVEMLWVDESSGTLDFADKHFRSRDHLNLNKFRSEEQEDFKILSGVLKTMVKEGPGIISSRRWRRFRPLTHSPLPVETIRMGRWAPDVRHPHHGYLDPEHGLQPYIHKTPQKEFQQIYDKYRSGNHLLGTILASRFANLLDNGQDVPATGPSTIYQLDNPEAIFNDAIQREKNREWIEEALKSHGKIYMIIGYHTVYDAHNESDVEQGKVFSSPSQAAATVSAAVAVLDQAEEYEARNATQLQQSASSLGEQVVAVQYRRIRFQFFNSGTLGPKNLESKTRWRYVWDMRGQAFDANDVIEASLAYDDVEDDAEDDDDYNDDDDDSLDMSDGMEGSKQVT